MKIVKLSQADALSSIRAANDCGMKSGSQWCHDGRLRVVRGSHCGGDDLGLLIAAPVIIRGELPSVTVMKLQGRIHERARDGDGIASRACLPL